MKSRMLVSAAAIALVTVGAAMAQTENRRPDDTARPQAQTPDAQRGQSQQPQARPQGQRQGQQQGQQGAQGSQPQSTTGQAPQQQQPQSGQAQSGQPSRQPQSAQPSGQSAQPSGQQQRQRTQSGQQQRNQQSPSQAQGTRTQGTQSAPAPAQGAQQRQGAPGTQQSGTPSSRQGTQQSTAPAQQQGSQAGAVQLNDQQRSRISTTISQQKVKPLANVNFSVSAGTVVPRTVRVQTLPSSIVSIVPQYRGYSYFVVEDRIVIVEPRTKKIVTVIEHSGGGRSGARANSAKKLELTNEQRASIRRHATSGQQRATTGSRASTERISVGERVPDSIELQSFPSTVYEEVPVVREYRYFVRESDVVVVDPGEQRIIEIIR